MQKDIRNFVIIAHIDHGKSTLADRFLEMTGTVEKRKMHEQYLDSMDLERERGITIKMQPVRMAYKLQSTEYNLNLIDTPGHVDFSYEVSRALAAVEGAILLVDATKGVQAQTLANLRVAIQQRLVIIPAINKIDLDHARVEEIEQEILDLFASFDILPERIHRISGKTGEGVAELLEDVIRKVPPPQGGEALPLRALVFDSQYDTYRGVVAHVRVMEGSARARERMFAMASKQESEIKEVGIFTPSLMPSQELRAGEIGYIATGFKDVSFVRVGDTLTIATSDKRQVTSSLPGYKEPLPVVFSSIFPAEGHDFDELKDALGELRLNDAALHYEQEYSEALGRGWKCGFLGMLHMEIVLERLRREHGVEVAVTTPSVVLRVRGKGGKEMALYTPSRFPDPTEIEEIREPWVRMEVITPPAYLNNVMQLLQSLRGDYKDTRTLGKETLEIVYETPLAELITDFYDKLKSVSSGYASLAYEVIDERPGDLVKLDIMLAGEKVEAFSRIVPRDRAEREGRKLVDKIKEVLPPESFAVAIQAAIGGKVVARETKGAMRKDVTGALYGGDYSRKKKLLEKQKKGKKRMKEFGRVHLDSETFMKVFRTT